MNHRRWLCAMDSTFSSSNTPKRNKNHLLVPTFLLFEHTKLKKNNKKQITPRNRTETRWHTSTHNNWPQAHLSPDYFQIWILCYVTPVSLNNSVMRLSRKVNMNSQPNSFLYNKKWFLEFRSVRNNPYFTTSCATTENPFPPKQCAKTSISQFNEIRLLKVCNSPGTNDPQVPANLIVMSKKSNKQFDLVQI